MNNNWLITYVKDKANNDNDDAFFSNLIEYFTNHISPGGNINDFYSWVEALTPHDLYHTFGVAYNL